MLDYSGPLLIYEIRELKYMVCKALPAQHLDFKVIWGRIYLGSKVVAAYLAG